MLKRIVIVAAVLSTFIGITAIQDISAADPPKDRVVAMYFHRTERCPTCKKMGAYTEEAMKQRFAKQLKSKSVAFHYVDFQDKKNDKLTKAYKITGPALIIARVSDNKVAEYRNLKDIWAKVGDKKAFSKYVEDNVAGYRKKQK